MIIGLTGSSGSGKSAAANFFRKHGFYIMDFDAIARYVCIPGSPCVGEMAVQFGNGIIAADGSLMRKALGDIVFADSKKLETLNAITRKYILAEAEKRRAECVSQGKDIIYDAPLLFEAGLDRQCDFVIAITADRQTRIERIMKRDGISLDTARGRLDSQHPNEYYERRSDFCVRNDGTESELYAELDNILLKIEDRIHDNHS